MSAPRFDPQPPLSNPRSSEPAPYVEPSANTSMWTVIVVLAVIVIGSIAYYATGPHLATNDTTPPISTTGAVPQSEPRPVLPAPPTRSAQ